MLKFRFSMSTYPVKRPNSVAFVLTTREPLCRRCNEIIRRKYFQIYTASDIATYGLHDNFATYNEERSDLPPPSYSSETRPSLSLPPSAPPLYPPIHNIYHYLHILLLTHHKYSAMIQYCLCY